MNKTIIIAIIVLLAGLVFYILSIHYLKYSLSRQIKSMPKSDVNTEQGWVTEDNIIRVDGLKAERASGLVAEIGKMYPFQMNSRWDGKTFLMSYPQGLPFFSFCCVVNYLNYPFDMTKDNKLTVMAWCTTNHIDWGGSPELMLYVPQGDTEYDNAYITTKDGHTFKQMFAIPEPCVKVEKLVLPYQERP